MQEVTIPKDGTYDVEVKSAIKYSKTSAEKRQERRRCTKPAKGYVHNPLKKWPRNSACFCGSNVKFKKCCLNKMSLYMPEKDAEDILEQLKTVKPAPVRLGRHVERQMEQDA